LHRSPSPSAQITLRPLAQRSNDLWPTLAGQPATKTVTVSLDGDGSRFVALTGSGHAIVMDNAQGDSGPRPAELLVVAQAGCTAMDVVSILRKKRQALRRYEGRVSAEQRDDPPPHVFERVRIVHVVDGPVEIEAVRRAVELSATKYCTVSGNLASGVSEIRHAYLVRDAGGEEHYGEVVVTGPSESPDAMGRRAAAPAI
jgi:putative redox protein